MKYFFGAGKHLKRILNKGNIFLFLDYDGTLAPIQDKPSQAYLSKKNKDLLFKLTKIPSCKVAVISGRSLDDVRKKVGIKNIIYAGNHGLEIEGPRIKLKKHINRKFLVILESIKAELVEKLSGIKGAFVEDKGLTLCFHYRLVGKKYIPAAKNLFRKIVNRYLIGDKIRVKSGKMIFEVRPATNWDKGKVILWLLSKQLLADRNKSVVPLCVGDDVTDEDAFYAVRNKGITILVGSPKRSCAKYYLKSTHEVTKLLQQVLNYYKEG
ncbi:MAG: trehalose-phosphatase [Candidatus Omnitrophota bacterium]